MSTPPQSEEVRVDGHCYCGAITFEVRIPAGERPAFVVYCHCDSCRRAHAAPLYHVAAVEASMFTITAGDEHLQPFTKPGGNISRAFCRVCGSKILNRFGSWRPNGKEVVAFFPSLLRDEIQRQLPEMFRPKKNSNADETVLEAALLGSLFDGHG